MILQTPELRHLGPDRLIVANFHVTFLDGLRCGAPFGRNWFAGQLDGGSYPAPVSFDPASCLPPPGPNTDGERSCGTRDS